MSHRFFFNRTLLIFSLLFATNVFGQNSWNVYRHPQFTFTYPSTWKIEDTQRTVTKAKLSANEKGYTANCAVTAYPFKETSNLSQQQINQLLSGQKIKPFDFLEDLIAVAPDLHLLQWTETHVSNFPAFYGEINYSVQLVATKTYFHALVVYIISPGYEWRILCGGGGTTSKQAKANFDYWKPTLQGIMSTFLFE